MTIASEALESFTRTSVTYILAADVMGIQSVVCASRKLLGKNVKGRREWRFQRRYDALIDSLLTNDAKIMAAIESSLLRLHDITSEELEMSLYHHREGVGKIILWS